MWVDDMPEDELRLFLHLRKQATPFGNMGPGEPPPMLAFNTQEDLMNVLGQVGIHSMRAEDLFERWEERGWFCYMGKRRDMGLFVSSCPTFEEAQAFVEQSRLAKLVDETHTTSHARKVRL
ncbi:MAG: hypothetical protein B7X39_14145 [Lysobacterales bacterium 14-68-21]|jgi:hypothetical protein|nr:MAG: hypothetical protein B7X45_13035 [Xanthomonadales bacterium 15-68-25]OZB65387.1 MAG: hypothetical protein B7X39_14145 [Xanthomonadales bacterium 14-68-21]